MMPLCPRCMKNLLQLNGLDAVSRTDNRTLICSPCGTAEGMEDFLQGSPLPQSDWPITL